MSGAPRQVGIVSELWRYPVSSLGGERLQVAELGATGVIGDRTVGLFDDATGAVAKPDGEKRWRTAPELRSRIRDGVVEISADGITWFAIDTTAARDAASATMGFPVRLIPFGEELPDGEAAAEPRYRRAGLHVLTTASLAALRSLVGEGMAIDSRRFRPNLLIETEQDWHGFAERGWIGRTLSVGDARLEITEPCARCSFVALAQGDLPFAPPVLQAIARHGEGGFGVYAEPHVGGGLRPGEAVYLS